MDSEEKFSRFSFGVTGGGQVKALELDFVKIFLYDFTFLRRKVPNSFASLVGSSCSERAVSSGSLDKELTTRNSLRQSSAH